ncbi:MAG: hypothetical protein QOD96_5190, partial [Pseudonocardiales bacterium]|nr:hypothetical protein [Pseudonocardiales bacterium]
LLQIRKHLGADSTDAGLELPLMHPVQLLDASIRGVPLPRG